MTLEEFQQKLIWIGKNNGPSYLVDSLYEHEIDKEIFTACIGEVWQAAENPEHILGRKNWVDLFELAGFTIDGKLSDTPVEAVRLYRGSTHTRRRGMSWTTNIEKAKWFATRFSGIGEECNVYTVLAPPESLLCYLSGRNESEYVVDTRGLKIKMLEE